MEEGETVSMLSRKELRKQKLAEYLAAKGKLKQPNPRAYLRDNCQLKKPLASELKVVMGKENKAPADRFSSERTKVATLAAKSTSDPTRRPFGVTNKVNVKGSFPNGRQNTNCPSAAGGLTQLKQSQYPVVTKKFTVAPPKSRVNGASHYTKQVNTGIQSSGAASSNGAQTAGTISNGKISGSSVATLSCPKKTISVRINPGPIVKTKTGLIPAVTQPRNCQSQKTVTSAATACSVRSSASSHVSVSKKSAVPQRKPATALTNPVNERRTISSTAKARSKVPVQSKSNCKPLLERHPQSSCKGPLPSGLKTSSSSKCTAAPIKPEGRVGMSKMNQSGGQPVHRSTKQTSQCEGGKNVQTSKIVSRPSTSRPASRATSGIMAELGKKTNTYKEKFHKSTHLSANAPPTQTGFKRTGLPALSQTVPRAAATVSCTGKAAAVKTTSTTKIPVRVCPQTEGKKLNAVQEERMRKLQEWRESKGISYKRPPMPVKPQVRSTVAVPQPFWTTMKEEDEAQTLIHAVDRSLDDCVKLLGEGFPPDQVKKVLSRLPAVAQKFSKYWICQARLMEREGNLDVLPMFEEAVGVVLEPVDELRTVVFEILKRKDEIQASDGTEEEEEAITATGNSPESINNPMMTPKPVRALIWGDKGDSSVVKYKITVTPGGPPTQQKEAARVNGHEVRFVTPVRRSVRIERASLRYPTSLQDHDLCVASYNDLISEEDQETSEEQKNEEASLSASNPQMYIYRQNEALKDKVFVKLVYDEGD